MLIGGGTGAVATGGTALLLLNVAGFPEVEGAEGLLLALAGEPLMTNFIVAANGAASGDLVGASVGLAATPSTCGNAGSGNQSSGKSP